jgi:hypothetical protein
VIIKIGESLIGPYELHYSPFESRRRYWLVIKNEIYEDFFASDDAHAMSHVDSIMTKVTRLQGALKI